MSPLLWLDILAGSTNIMLGLFVLWRAPWGCVQRVFTFLTLAIGLWIFSLVAVRVSEDPARARTAVDAVFASGLLLGGAMMLFAGVFPARERPDRASGLGCFVGIGLMVLAPFHAYESAVLPGPGGSWTPVRAPLSEVGAGYLLLATIFFMYRIGANWRAARGLERAQAQYLMVGAAASGGVAILTNLIAPLLFHNSSMVTIGPAATITFALGAGYSIARFRLLDISRVMALGALYGLSLILLMALLGSCVVLADRAIGPSWRPPPGALQAVSAVLLAAMLQPLFLWGERFLDRVFFRSRVDSLTALRRVSRELAAVLDISPLIQYLRRSIPEILLVEQVGVILLDGGGVIQEPLLGAMKSARIVVREESLQATWNTEERQIAAQLWDLSAEVAAPLIHEGELVGVILAGPKISGKPFNEDDIGLLSTIANQAVTSVLNAQLYHQIRSSEQSLATIFERLDSALITVDVSGKVTSANEAARRLFPEEGDELLLPPTLRFAARRVFESGQDQSDLEFDVLGPNERTTPVVATVCPLVFPGAAPRRALIALKDLSVIRRLEDERVRNEKVGSMRRLAAALAHELRNPLASIKTFFQLFPEQYSEPEFRNEFATLAAAEVERIDVLLSNLLNIDRAPKDAWELISLQEIVSSATKLMAPVLREKGLHLGYDFRAEGARIEGDRARLHQLFLNLLLNARDACPRGGSVSVSVLTVEEEVVAEIQNDGVPIPADVMARLFDPFFSTKPNGTGLGLAVCKEIAIYHRGDLLAKSSPEGKIVFRLTLPRARSDGEAKVVGEGHTPTRSASPPSPTDIQSDMARAQ